MKKCMQKIKNMPLQPSSIYSCPWQMSKSAFFPSKILRVVIFWWETAYVSKAREWFRSWQMPGPRVAQNLQMPHPRDWQGGQMPRSSPWGEGGAGRSWNWLMHKKFLLCKSLCEQRILVPDSFSANCLWEFRNLLCQGSGKTRFPLQDRLIQ